VKLIEDCAQSHCAEINGTRVGGIGVASGFSFYPGKNMGAYGEGGAMLTNDDELARQARMLRDHGMSRKYVHEVWGHNYRMEGFQGAILEVKLNHIEAWTEARRDHARRYSEGLAQIGPVQTPYERPGSRHVYHLYIVRVPRRAELMEFLSGEGVSTGLHYPGAPAPAAGHRQPGWLQSRRLPPDRAHLRRDPQPAHVSGAEPGSDRPRLRHPSAGSSTAEHGTIEMNLPPGLPADVALPRLALRMLVVARAQAVYADLTGTCSPEPRRRLPRRHRGPRRNG
jgi:hypothetical protein